jgi:AraC family transcriptional regulator
MFPVEIRDMPAARVAALPHRGSYQSIGATFGRLWQRLGETGLVSRIAGPGIGLYHDAPGAVAVADQRAHAGVVIAADATLPEGMDSIEIPGGRSAVLTFRGPYDGLADAWAYLYGHWLPASGEETADSPPYERNLNSPMDTAPADLVTEIVLPLA